MTEGLLVVGHGTRSDAGQAECAALVERIGAARPRLPVAHGYLELCPPPITDAVAGLVGAGSTDITVVPLVLLAAGHAKGDVPAAIARERARHPGVTLRYGRPLGLHPDLLALADRRLDAAVAPHERPDTAVVVVGRGSTDPDANGELAKAARLLWEGHDWPLVEPAFVSLTEPRVPAALDRVAALGARRVVVLAYFLFTGVLEERIREQAAAWASAHPEVEVRTAGYLGPDGRVADVVLERFEQGRAGEVHANCDTCQYRVALPGFEDRVGQPQTLHFHPHDPATHTHDSQSVT